MFEKIKKWYLFDLWTEKMVRSAAEKSVLTWEQAAQILEWYDGMKRIVPSWYGYKRGTV